jgi:hypothetical protein
MRKHQQRQILELLQTLEEAQGARLYADCQEVALQVGEFIESLAGEGTKTVELLEEYCELLYEVNIGEQNAKALKKHLYKIESSVKSELKPNKIEIVFLSYKASMSDSIESIYLAAKNDPNCDAYWIPVPYYERNSDGSFGQMRYEGAEFYDNLDCTDWQSYDIEARHPEIIFTFAPYDAGNYVTSVHPDFYCERLRNLTDLLVYTPYFVAVDGVSENFVTVAGCIFAHKVIVQSEEVRDTYVKIFKEQFGNQFGKPEDKFIALGSPKFDAVLSTKREIISDKKVVLYNTTVGAILQDSAQYLKKLRSVLEVFRNRDDVTLWWRPHPLSESTFESMRPELAAEYRAIVAEYRADNFGILDKAPEGLHRAIALSDAYYGDWSSLVALYGVTGKPIMIQDVNFLHGSEHRDALLFEACYDDGKYIWFAAYWFNGLFKCDKETWVAEYLGSFPGENYYNQRLFGSTTECNGKLYFAPLTADAIAVYNIASGEFSRIELNDVDSKKYSNYYEYYKFIDALTIADSVYFIPATYPAIVVVDTLKREITYIDGWVDKIEKLRNSNGLWFGRGDIEVERIIYAALLCADYMLIIDSKTNDFTLEALHSGNIGHLSICFDGDNFWLAPRCKNDTSARITRWNRETTEVIILPQNGVIITECADWEYVNFFFKMYFRSGKIYALPHHYNCGFVIDADSSDISSLQTFQSEYEFSEKSRNNYPAIAGYWYNDSKIYAIGAKTGNIYEYDTYTEATATYKVLSDMKGLEARPHNEANGKTIPDFAYYETDFIDIDKFINVISGGSHNCEKQQQIAVEAYLPNGANSGQTIYNYCKSELIKEN